MNLRERGITLGDLLIILIIIITTIFVIKNIDNDKESNINAHQINLVKRN